MLQFLKFLGKFVEPRSNFNTSAPKLFFPPSSRFSVSFLFSVVFYLKRGSVSLIILRNCISQSLSIVLSFRVRAFDIIPEIDCKRQGIDGFSNGQRNGDLGVYLLSERNAAREEIVFSANSFDVSTAGTRCSSLELASRLQCDGTFSYRVPSVTNISFYSWRTFQSQVQWQIKLLKIVVSYFIRFIIFTSSSVCTEIL